MELPTTKSIFQSAIRDYTYTNESGVNLRALAAKVLTATVFPLLLIAIFEAMIRFVMPQSNNSTQSQPEQSSPSKESDQTKESDNQRNHPQDSVQQNDQPQPEQSISREANNTRDGSKTTPNTSNTRRGMTGTRRFSGAMSSGIITGAPKSRMEELISRLPTTIFMN